MNTIKWETLKEKALSLVQKGLIFPYEYKHSFDREGIPSDEELAECRKLIDLAENYRMSPDIFTKYDNFRYERRRSTRRRGR
jgi:hypothetical protein